MDKTRPRKRPQQARSRFLFDAMLQATRELLEEDGYEGTTPTLIAARAGVSPGSLYQYFPAREALIGEVIDEQMKSDEANAVRAAAQLRSLPLREMLQVFTVVSFVMHREHQAIYTALVPHVAEAGRAERQERLVRTLVGLLEGALAEHRDQLRTKDPRLAAFFAVHGLLGVLHGALRDWPELIGSDEALDAAADWLVRWLVV